MTCERGKITVLHLITRFDMGGSAENTFLTASGLDRSRYELVLATGEEGPKNPGDAEAAAVVANRTALRASGIRVVVLPSLKRDPAPLSDLAAFLSLLRLIRREQPRIVHTHTSKAGILGRWAAWLCRVPVIVHTPHGHVFWGYFGPLKTWLFVLLERWTARITTALVMLTEREKADHLRLRIARDEKFRVIHSGVDLARFHSDPARAAQTRASLGVPADAIVVATAGRLTAVKGQSTLIRAVAACRRRGNALYLLVLGEGELRRGLEDLATELGIAESVRFLGWRPDVAPIIDACDFFCLPSLNEGMGKVLVEAMALAKPIIASDVGGIPDLVVPGENGLLVPPADPGALAEAILALCADQEGRLRMGEAGKHRAQGFSAEEMVQKIDRLYSELSG